MTRTLAAGARAVIHVQVVEQRTGRAPKTGTRFNREDRWTHPHVPDPTNDGGSSIAVLNVGMTSPDALAGVGPLTLALL